MKKGKKKEKIQHNKLKQAEIEKKQPSYKLLYLIIFVFSFIIYANSISNGYVLDDFSVIKENAIVKKGTKGIKEIFTTTYRYGYWGRPDDLYRPLSLVMFAVEWQLWPDNPMPGHLINVILYSLLCVLLLMLLIRLFKSYSIWLPFLSTLIFAAHPIHTEVVANIKSRDEILCFLFLIISIWYLLNYISSKEQKNVVIALLAYFFAFLSKESAITFLAVFPLTIYFFTNSDIKTNLKASLIMLVPAIIFLIIRKNVVGFIEGSSVSVVDNLLMAANSLNEHTATAIKILGIYLYKQFYPHPLICDSSFNQIPIVGWSSLAAITSFLIHAAAGLYAIYKIKSKNIISFSILFYFVTISLYTNLFFTIGSSYGERFLFIPVLSICIIISYLLIKYLSLDSLEKNIKPSSSLITVSLFILLFYSLKTISRNTNWESDNSLYTNDIKHAPNSAHLRYYYGLSLMKDKSLNEKGEVAYPEYLDSAIVQFEIAAKIIPTYADAYDQLGLAWFRKNNYDKSLEYYNKAISLNPGKANTYSNMGFIYFYNRDYEKALELYNLAVTINPFFSDAWLNLGSTYGTLGRYNESINAFLKCITYDKNNATAHYFLAITYRSAGDNANAEKYLKIAGELDSKYLQKNL